MKFSLILEAVDKATKTISSIAKAEKSLNADTVLGAEKSARAHEKNTQALNKNVAAAEKAAAATQKVTKAEKEYNNAAQKMTRLSETRIKGWRNEANAVERLNKVLERWINLQAKKGGRAGYQLGTGLSNIGNGAKGIGKYGALVGAGALAVGSLGFAAGMSGTKQARDYQALVLQMRAVTKSADEAKQAMSWIESAQMPPYGLDDLTKSYIQLKNIGIDPTKGALANIADAAVGSGKSIEQATNAYIGAVKGNLDGLKALGITAKKNGKYVDYMFAGKDGRLKRYRALSGNRMSNAHAVDKITSSRFGGASAAYGKTWDGMIWKMSDTWEHVKLKIMNSGLFDFLSQKLDMFVTKIDQWAQDGTLDTWCKNLSKNLILVMTIAWDVATKLYRAGEAIFGFLDSISGYVGGWENLTMILLALPVVPSLMRMAMGFIQVGQGIATFIGIGGRAIGLFAQLNGFSKIGAVLRLLLTPIGLVTKSFITMGIAFMSSPIGWIVAGIVAIAAGAYLIYQNWDKLGPFFKNVWEKTKQIFADFWNYVKSLFTWDNVFTVVNWFSYLIPIRWVEFIPGFPGWDNILSLLTWDNFLTVLNWLSYLNPIRWIEFIPGFPGWNNILTLLTWDNFLKVLNWLSYLNPIRWIEFVPGFPGWNKVIKFLSWRNFIKVLKWLSYLHPLRWIKFIPGFPGWNTVISWLSWDNFLAALEWVKYISKWLWETAISKFSWTDWLTPLEWLKFIPDFPDWNTIINSEGVKTVINSVVDLFNKAKEKIGEVFKQIGRGWDWLTGVFSKKNTAVDVVVKDPAIIQSVNDEVDKLSQKLDALSKVDFSATNAGLLEVQNKTAETIAKGDGIAKAFEYAINGAKRFLEKTSFESHGVALMRTFAIGIRNGANEAIAATREVVGEIRDYLPHSPAKRGPLSDLNKVRFSETLATAIKPGPVVRATERVVAGMRGVLSDFSGPLNVQPNRPLTAGLPGGNSGNTSVSVNFSPVINVAGNADKTTMHGVMQQVMAELQNKLPGMLDKVSAARKRREY